MDIAVLGPITVSHEGRPVPVGGKPAALLALLVAAHPSGLTAERAVDAVWPTKTAAAGLNNLRVNLTKLRRALGADGVVVFDGGRYHLRIAEESVDVLRFRAGAAEARAALAAGSVRRAVERSEGALREWRGMAYEDILGVDLVDAERAQLDQERLDVLRDCAEALIADERPDAAIRLLLPVWEADRSSEAIAEPLITAQRLCRRPVDALATFRATRDALRDDFGITPSRDFAELEYEILDPVAGTAHPIATPRGPRFRRPAKFIGRDDELGALHDAWAEAMAGTPRLALVAGPPGIGKSALLHTFASDVARDDAASVLLGTCEEDPAGPYIPFAELVRAALSESLPDTPPALLSELSRLAPELAARLPPSEVERDPAAGRQRLFEAVASVLAHPTGPRLVVLDDMHWVQPDAVAMFRQVLRSASGQTMIVAAYRLTTPPKPNAFLRSMEHGRLRTPDVHLRLPPMNHHELVALIDEAAPSERRLEFLRAVDDFADITAGNPLFVCEAIRQLEMEPDLHVSEVMPDAMRSLVERRLGRLGREERRTVEAASVIGRVFSLTVLAAVSGVSEEQALDTLDEAMASGLIVDMPGRDAYSFAHPLMRNAVYSGQAHPRRLRTHVRAADALADLHDDARVPEIARHLLTARPVSDPRRTWNAAKAAGDDALARFAHDAAVAWYQAAMTCEDPTFDPLELAELRLDLGVALDRCARLDEARLRYFEAVDIARTSGDAVLLVRAIEAATPREVVLDRDYAERLRTAARDALDFPELGPAARVAMIRTQVFADYYMQPERALSLVEDATHAAAASTDPRTRLHLLSIEALLADRDDDDARLDYAREAYEICTRTGLEVERGMAVRRYLTELLVCGRMTEFDTILDQLTATADTVRIPSDHHYAASLTALRSLMRAPDDTAENQIEAARVIGLRGGVHWADGLYQLLRFTLYYQRGALVASEPVREATTDDPQISAGLALHALTAVEVGDLDGARSILDRIVRDDEIRIRADNFWLGAVALFGGVAARCGSAGQRRVLRRALEPRAERFCVFGTGGSVFGTGHHWLARLAEAEGEHDVAHVHLTHAIQICQDADASYWADRARDERSQIGEQASID